MLQQIVGDRLCCIVYLCCPFAFSLYCWDNVFLHGGILSMGFMVTQATLYSVKICMVSNSAITWCRSTHFNHSNFNQNAGEINCPTCLEANGIRCECVAFMPLNRKVICETNEKPETLITLKNIFFKCEWRFYFIQVVFIRAVFSWPTDLCNLECIDIVL